MPENLEDLIEEIIDRNPNNTLVMSLAPIFDEDPYAYLLKDFEEPKPIESIISMDGVVYGYFNLPIEIIDEYTEEEAGEETAGEQVIEDMPYPDMPVEAPYPMPPGS